MGLIDRFVGREIDAEQFEAEYLRMVKDDEVIHGDPAFGVIDELFFHIDEYFVPPGTSADDRARQEEALRARACTARQKLRAL
ncbi:colicin immunity domain-containing protein [Amycolatopsis saalfeldensis]|uniref:Self-protective colicin-like immunity n=1 Tax=Amycolatopsis saalfeldensis TaxID=394193 RepID=A0A1H8XQ76_9PSEU|nr:colicin immunity domain-containing protein [Amycolatopsis saalfeldensis]SEP42264.1 self-protective colicin-like immunity [Amycolatopsis saalfeldensis]